VIATYYTTLRFAAQKYRFRVSQTVHIPTAPEVLESWYNARAACPLRVDIVAKVLLG
jgi:hypothetical protein